MSAGAKVAAAFGGTFEVRLLAITLFGPGSLYTDLYSWAAGSAAAIVIAYMTARSIEKTKGRDAAVSPTSAAVPAASDLRSEEHTSELQSLLRISYAVFCLKIKTYVPTS